MVLGGLWHGAAWTFVFWGLLHGGALVIHLVIHKEWSQFAKQVPALMRASSWLAPVSMLMTFYWVCISWVFFRADSFASALTVLRSFVLH